ncbi:MAG: hypothetical protein ABWW65_03855 [Thermoprotei archaeon]
MITRKILFASLVISSIYCLIVLLVSYILMFPGFGAVILPQPFIKVVIGRWTIVYDPFNLYGVLWFFYMLLIHLAVLKTVYMRSCCWRAYIIGVLIIYVVNLALVLLGFSDPGFRDLVIIYDIRYLGTLLGYTVTLLIEYTGVKVLAKLFKGTELWG